MVDKLSYEFIESGVILSIKSLEDLKKIKVTPKSFRHHGPALKFITEYFDEHGSFPGSVILKQKFDGIDAEAEGAATLDYFLETFKKQSLYQDVVEEIRKKKSELSENPVVTVSEIINKLSGLISNYDEDIFVYDSGSSDRLDEYEKRKAQRKVGLGIIGVPTPFSSLNGRGVGWLSGELVSIFARPTVGKSWLCVKVAAVGQRHGFKTLLVTTEMPARQMSLRIDVVLGNMMGYQFSHKALRRGDEIDTGKYKEYLEKVKGGNLPITDHIGENSLSVAGIASLIRKHKPQLVVVDGVYLLSNDSGTQAWEKNDNLFKGLKNLAMQQNVAIIASTQANRDASDLFVPPRAEEVAYGDALLRHSDIAMSMCKVESDEMSRVVQFQKMRDDESPVSITYFRWDVDRGDIKETQGGVDQKVANPDRDIL